ncbi:MAG: hypothetical protein ACRC3G_01950 [Bacteroidales bacterium]
MASGNYSNISDSATNANAGAQVSESAIKGTLQGIEALLIKLHNEGVQSNYVATEAEKQQLRLQRARQNAQ